MSDETDQNVEAPSLTKSTKELKGEAMIMAIGFSLGITVVILMLGTSMAFLFAGLLIYLFSLKPLTTKDKIPAFAAVIAIALLGGWMFSAGGVTTGFQPIGGGLERVDGMTTGQLDGRNCTQVNLGGGQSMMQCD